MPSLDNTADGKPGIDPILLKVLDAVPFRLSTDDGIGALRQRLRDLPRRRLHPELRVEDRAIDGPAGPTGIRIYWPPTDPDRSATPPVVLFSMAAASSWATLTRTTAPPVCMPSVRTR